MFDPKRMAWLAWLIVSCFYAYQYILRVMPGIMLNDITQRFHIDAGIFGQFTGVYYIGYALMQLPIGILIDRIGPKKVLPGCIVLSIIGLIPMIVADHWIYIILGRAILGIGSSAAILGVFYIIRMTFTETHFSRMLSFSVTIGLLGAMYGGYPVSTMNHIFGYQATVEIFCIVGVCLACITYFIIPEVKPERQLSILTNIKTIFMNRKVIMLCCCAGLMVGPLEGFADVWGPAFLHQVYSLNSTEANTIPSIIYMGMCFFGPLLSIFAEKTGYYLGLSIAAGVIMFLVFTTLVVSGLSVSNMSISFAVVGVCCAYQILTIYKASTYVPKHIAGLTTAVANVIIMGFGYAFHTSIGFIIHLNGGTQNAQALLCGMWIIPSALAVGIIGLCLLAYREQLSMKIRVILASPYTGSEKRP